MSLLAMDTSSLFDPFEFPPEIDMETPKPQPKFREKLEIKSLRHHDHHPKDTMVARESDFKSRDFVDVQIRQHDPHSKVLVVENPSPTTALGASDVQSARQKLRDSLTSALDMVVSKQLVKSVLGVGANVELNARNELKAGQNISTLEVLHPASLSQEHESPKDGHVVDSLVVDLGPLESETMNIDSMGGGLSVPELVASVGDYRLNFDQSEYGDGADVVESPFKRLKTDFAQFDYVHRKLEIEEKEGRIAVEDVKGGLHIVDQARKLATDIEAELFKLCGSKKTYNQKARSLLFNLKDKSNPELRARVFSGEIPPADLCRMTGEQLASKELSDWRNAKEQALDKMLVLTDADTVSGKVVKKTHKGEFVVDVQNESTVDIVPVVTRSVFPVTKAEEKAEQEVSVQMEGQVNHSQTKSKYGTSPSLKRSRSDESARVGVSLSHSNPIAEEPNTAETTEPELHETETVLPTIMSLDEYMEAQEEDAGVQEDVFEDAPIEPRGFTTPSLGLELQEVPDKTEPVSTTPKAVKEETVSKREASPKAKHVEAPLVVPKQPSETRKIDKNDKSGVAWTGQIQLSGNRQSPLVVKHRSGENVELKNWPKSLELKGRVRLAHLDKFLQELQQSRSRAVTVVSLLVQDGHADQASAHVKEVATQYQMGDRVGFVEPRSGYELYLLPPGSGTTKLLSEHGHPEVSPEALGKDVVLVGVIVWRRSRLSSSSARQPERNNNVKRHAVASSTHHHESKSSRGAGVGPSKEQPSSDLQPRSSRPRGTSTPATNVSPASAAAAAAAAASSIHILKFPVESSPTKERSPSSKNWPSSTPPTTTCDAHVLQSHHILPAPSDATADMPPGFSLRPPAQPSAAAAAAPSRHHVDPRSAPSLPPADCPPGFWPRPALAAQQPLSEEDDDLPEFDFSVHAVAGSPPEQFNPVEAPPVSHLSQFPSRQSPARVMAPPPEQGSNTVPPVDFSSGYPPRPPGPPPLPQAASGFLPRPNYYPAVAAAPMAHEGDQYRPSQQESLRGGGGGQVAMLGALPHQQQQYGGGSSLQVGAAAPPLRNDLPEWRPSAQFQLRPPLHEGAATAPPPHLHFDPAAAVGGAPPPLLPVHQQEMTWPPPPQQHHQQQQQQQQASPTILPPPPPPPPPQWHPQPQAQPQEQARSHFQPPWQQQHSNHFQQQAPPQQQHMAPSVRASDPRGGGPYNTWEATAGAPPPPPPPWEAAAATRNPINSSSNNSNEHHRDNRTSGGHRMKDSRSSDQLSWHDNRDDNNGNNNNNNNNNNRNANGGRSDFRRR